MDFPQDQIEELKQIAPSVSIAAEGGYTFFLIEKLKLPIGCSPTEVDALLCPTLHSGYCCRLFFAQQITGCSNYNWNGQLRALERNWHAISWQTEPNLRLLEQVMIHLKPFRK
jgi:hypothetical protein